MDNTRILIIAPTPFFADRGCHTHIAEQAWALKRQHKDVLLTTYGIGRDLPGITTKRTPRFPWYKKESIGPSWHKFYIDIFLFYTTFKATWNFKPDIIHGHLHEGCLIGWVISRVFNIPLVFDCQGSLTGELLANDFILAKPKILQKIWIFIEKKIDHLPNIILAQSTEMRRELIEQFKVDPDKITMAFDGVNTHTFQPQKKDTTLLKKLNLPQDKTIIVYLGGLTTHKGIDTLLKAFSIIQTKHPDIYLLLMGYPNEHKYKKRARELGILDRTRITGRIRYEDAPRYLTLGDIAVAPKRTQTEANGKIYNYMAAGLPTVAFDTVVNRDILGDLGVYTNPEKDYQGLANAINLLLKDKNKQNYLAKTARATAVAKYSWDNVAKRIISAYKQIQTPWQIKVFNVSIRKKAKWKWLKPKLKTIIKPTSKCLDIGSGVGTISYQQEQLGGTWIFTETNAKAAEQTQRIVQGKVLKVNIEDPILEPSSFDVITALDVIEHVDNPHEFLKKVHYLLKPGGKAIITTPADNNRFYSMRYIAEKVFKISAAEHGHTTDGFSTQELNKLFQQANLLVSHSTRFSKFFTELIELSYNAAYIAKNKYRQQTTGYNLSLSPASQNDFTRHEKLLPILRILNPFFLAISELDNFLPERMGYEWGIVISKNK
jgi:glycosyltransferase involved in cell wall biosynthesis